MSDQSWVFKRRDLSFDLEESEVRSITKLGQELIVATTAFTFVSNDNGENWDKIEGGAGGGGVVKYEDSVIAWTKFGSWKRAKGMSWSSNNAGLHHLSIDHIFAQRGYVIAGIKDLGVLRSTDGGSTWAPSTGIPKQATLTEIIGTPDGNLLAGHLNHAIYKSTDDGTTWLESTQGLLSTVVYSLQRVGDSVLAFTFDDVFLSTNSGGSWVGLSLDDTLGYPRSYLRLGDRTIWAGYDGLWMKLDNEERWTRVFAGYTNRIFSAGSVLIAGDQNVFVSKDEGATWDTASTLTGRLESILQLAPNVTLAATTYGMNISQDSGVTWSALPSYLDKSFVRDLVYDPVTHEGYLGIDGEGIHTFSFSPATVSSSTSNLTIASPNPTQGILSIAFETALSEISYEVFDVAGRLRTSGTVPIREQRFQLDIRSLTPGHYILTATDGRISRHVEIVLVR